MVRRVESAAPSLVDGGAAYTRYQWTPKMALAGRFEYFNDRNGLYSGTAQALKEFTGTYDYKVGEGLLTQAGVQEGLEQCAVLSDE